MNLKSLLLEKKSVILAKWFDRIVETYPTDTSNFLKRQKNTFANPVGAAITQGIEGIFDELLEQRQNDDRIAQFLDDIIRIRAVQNFTPSEALSFIFSLKKAIRKELKQEIRENDCSDELDALEVSIDNLALSSFDIYVKCREKIYEIKAEEVKRMTFRLLQRANLVRNAQDQEPMFIDSSRLDIKRKEADK